MARLVLLDTTRTGKNLEIWIANSAVWSLDRTKQFTKSSRRTRATRPGYLPLAARLGIFCSAGPTGSGKTHIVEATAQSLLSEARAMIKMRRISAKS
jgi:hypothetical protein